MFIKTTVLLIPGLPDQAPEQERQGGDDQEVPGLHEGGWNRLGKDRGKNRGRIWKGETWREGTWVKNL